MKSFGNHNEGERASLQETIIYALEANFFF
jgi:hypothetical protein